MRGRELLRLVKRKPLSYKVVAESRKSGGGHRKLESPNGYPPLMFSFHDNADIKPRVVRKVLVNDIGLTEEEALNLL